MWPFLIVLLLPTAGVALGMGRAGWAGGDQLALFGLGMVIELMCAIVATTILAVSIFVHFVWL